MHILLGFFFIGHAIAHLVGFLTSWKIMETEEMPYKTTLLSGKLDVGERGIRIVGVMWLLAATAFVVAGIGALWGLSWWQPLTIVVAGFSLALSIFGWPDARFGVVMNGLILGFLFIGGPLGWIPTG